MIDTVIQRVAEMKAGVDYTREQAAMLPASVRRAAQLKKQAFKQVLAMLDELKQETAHAHQVH